MINIPAGGAYIAVFAMCANHQAPVATASLSMPWVRREWYLKGPRHKTGAVATRYSSCEHCGWSHWQAISTSSLPASRHASPQYFCPSGTSQRHGIWAHFFTFGFSMVNFLQAESSNSTLWFG